MHESRVVRDLIIEAEMQAATGRITCLNFRIGALAAVTPGALRHGATALAEARWGHSPAIEITHGTDPTVKGAQSVRLISIRVED